MLTWRVKVQRFRSTTPHRIVSAFEAFLQKPFSWDATNVKGYYYVALAYEKSGAYDKAIGQYEEFIDTWKDADVGIEEIGDAKQRLAALRAQG